MQTNSLMEKKRARQASRQDLRDKLALEDVFKRDIRSVFRRMRDDFRIRFAAVGSPVDASQYQQEWKTLLQKQYERVQKQFSGTVKSFMFYSSLPTKQEGEEFDNELFALALLEYRTRRSGEQADIITRTNERDIRDAVSQARQSLIEQGEPVDNRSVSMAAGAILARKFAGRVEVISMTETQNAAETAKFIEAQVSAGIVPSGVPQTIEQIVRPRVEPRQAEKEWDDIGDSKVRATHRAANGQRVPMNAPFRVGSSLLMYPGDTSLGAEIKEVAGCRCSSRYFFQ